VEKKIIVFDFDKTLINYDSTFAFYKFCIKKSISRKILIPIYLLLKVLSRLNIISVKKEKEIGLFLFCPKDKIMFILKCKKFSETIKLNTLYKQQYLRHLKNNDIIIIASASFKYYLKQLFPNKIIIGSTIKFNKSGQIIGIKNHPFKKEKSDIIKSMGYSKIDEFYTDSKNDKPTSLLADKTYWVKNGKIINK